MIDSINKKIIIHNYSFGPCTEREFQISDITISLYYLSKDVINDLIEMRYSEEYIKQKGYIKEGFIIEAKIKAVVAQNIKYIDKDYFENIYNEFDKLNFEKLAIEGNDGFDGGNTEVELIIKNGFNEFIKKVSLWCPDINEYDKKSDLNKLLNLIEKIKFDEWYNNLYAQWQDWENKLEDYYSIFQYNKENDC